MVEIHISGGVVHAIPNDFGNALRSKERAIQIWETITPLARNEWICWIESVKKHETRMKHIERAVRELLQGKRRPCCWYGCIHRIDKSVSPSVKNLVMRKKSGR